MRMFRIISSRFLLAVMVFLASAPGSAAKLPRSSEQTACQAAACIFLPLLPYAPIPPVEISAQTEGCTRFGTYEMRGEIRTTRDIPVYDVRIEVPIYNRNNQLVGTAGTTTVLTATLPGQLNPFEIDPNISCHIDGIHGVPKIVGWDPASAVTYAPLSTDIFPKLNLGDLVSQVWARIQNDGPVPLENVKAIIWSVQQSDGMIGYDIADSIAPGEVITMTREFYSISVDIAGVRASAQGVVPAQP